MGLSVRSLDGRDVFTLMLGLLAVVKIRVVGTFSLSEFLLLAMYFTSSVYRWKRDRNCVKLFVFASLWLVGTVISDYVNQSDTIDALKGAFFIVMMMLLIPPIYSLLYDKPERVLLYFVGTGISGLYSHFFAATDFIKETMASDVYRFYAYAAFGSVFVYIFYFKGKKNLAIFIREVIAILTLFHASRNYFLTTTIAAVLLLYINKIKGSTQQRVISFRKKVPTLLVAGLIGVLMVDVVYEELASSGVLGQAAFDKYMTQKQTGNIVQGGRMATFMGIELIKQKPITGWGSYAKDTWGFMSNYYYQHNIDDITSPELEYELPAHSYIVGAWMQNGILGGVFWIFIIVLVWKIFKSGCLLHEPRILGMMMYLFVGLLWDWAFSPFGDRMRFLFIMLSMLVIYDYDQKGCYSNSSIIIKKLKI